MVPYTSWFILSSYFFVAIVGTSESSITTQFQKRIITREYWKTNVLESPFFVHFTILHFNWDTILCEGFFRTLSSGTLVEMSAFAP